MSVAVGTDVAVDPDGTTDRRPARLRRWMQGDAAKIMVPLVVAIVAISLYTNSENSNFLSWGNLENIGVQASVLAIVAVGQTFLVAAGQLDLSVGSLASLVSVLVATWLTRSWSEPLVIALAVAVGAAVGLAWGLLVAYVRIAPFILTLGGLSVLSSIALQRAGDRPVAARAGLGWLRTGEVVGIRWPIVLALAVVAVASSVLRYSAFGRHVYVVGSSEEAAYLAGIPVQRTKICAFVVSGALVGLAGVVLVTRLGAGDPRGGAGLELRAIAAVVLGGATLAGGRGSPLGTALGVVLLSVIQTSLTFLKIDASYEGLVFGGVLIVAVGLTALIDRRRGSTSSWRRLLGRPAQPPASDDAGGPGVETVPPSRQEST